MSIDPVFQLAVMVRDAIAAENGASQLSEAIREAFRRSGGGNFKSTNESAPARAGKTRAGGSSIDRRTLTKIAKGDEGVSLSPKQLRMLDAYFTPKGQSLAIRPIFESRSILLHVAQTKELVFLLGAHSRKEEMRIDISHWDFKSVTQLIHDINLRGSVPGYTLEQVVHEDVLSPDRFNEQGWFEKLRDDVSVITVGSPLVNHATELVLSKMFPVTATGGRVAPDSLPFGFVWSEISNTFRSTFRLSSEAFLALARRNGMRVETRHRKGLASGTSRTCALVHGKVVRWSEPSILDKDGSFVPTSRYKTYGIVAAQRRSGGGIWIAISGLSGPATYGAASIVNDLVAHLPDQGLQRHSKPVWVVVETTVTVEGKDVDPRRVIKQEIVMTSSASAP